MDSEYSGGAGESSAEHMESSCEDYDGVDIDETDGGTSAASALGAGVCIQSKPSPQVSLPRRGSQDSITGALRVTRPTPATPRIVHHSLPPLGYTPAPTGVDNSVFLGSAKHGRPVESMYVDPLERKKRRVGGGSATEVSRFRSDFTDVSHLGKGSFSDVFKVKSRVDGQVYAIKRLKKQCISEADRRRSEGEARVHASLSREMDTCPSLSCHIVKYHTAWFEDGRLFIQTEFCPSSLPDLIADNGGPLPESTVVAMLRDVAKGLMFLHRLDLVHLDIKPANIFVSPRGLFKIGDLGLVSPAGEPAEVTSGDARYLPREILLNNFKNLPKADIFSLGATALECMLAQRLEAEGEEWHRLRDGHIPEEEMRYHYSEQLIRVIRDMMHPEPERRPAAETILTYEFPVNAVQAASPRDDVSPGSSIIKSLRHTRHKLRKLFTTST
jgi:serine/threonine protein kinase